MIVPVLNSFLFCVFFYSFHSAHFCFRLFHYQFPAEFIAVVVLSFVDLVNFVGHVFFHYFIAAQDLLVFIEGVLNNLPSPINSDIGAVCFAFVLFYSGRISLAASSLI